LSDVPAAFSLQQSSVRSTTVTVNPVNGFSGTVILSASGVPPGVTAYFSPASTTSTSSLSINADATAPPGTAILTIKGTSGSITETAQLSLTVLASAPSGGLPASFFALSNVDPTDDPNVDGMSYGAVGHPEKLAWPYIESARGVYDFSLYDQYAAIAPREGPGGTVAIMDLTLGMTPSWAVADQSTCRTLSQGVTGCQAPPDNIQDWKDFITALVRHYDGSGSTPHIKYYEIWNEWNVSDPANGYWIGPIPSLVALQTTACAIIHAADPYSKVLTPSTVGMARSRNDQAPQQLANYFSYGGTNCASGVPIDGVSFHGIVAANSVSPYPLPGEGCSGTGCNGTIQEIASSYFSILQQNFAPGSVPPLLDTEGSFESGSITDPDQRAAWLAQFYALQAGLYTSDQLQSVSWFTWGVPTVPGNVETANQTPDTAGKAYNQVFHWLYARIPAACMQSGTVWTCPLTGASGYQAEILWDDSRTCDNGTCTTSAQTAPPWAVQMRDLAGTVKAITGGGTIQIGLKPVIVEN